MNNEFTFRIFYNKLPLELDRRTFESPNPNSNGSKNSFI